jgi:hypothetical protein
MALRAVLRFPGLLTLSVVPKTVDLQVVMLVLMMMLMVLGGTRWKVLRSFQAAQLSLFAHALCGSRNFLAIARFVLPALYIRSFFRLAHCQCHLCLVNLLHKPWLRSRLCR